MPLSKSGRKKADARKSPKETNITQESSKKVFVLHPAVYPSEFIEVLKPARITMLRFRQKKQGLSAHDMFEKADAQYLFIKKLGVKFGNPSVPSMIDYLYYTFSAFLNLRTILKNDAVVFIGPPFFDCLIIPILRLFKKEIYLILMDAQREVALNFNKKMGPIRRTYYYFAEKLEDYSVRKATKVFPVSRFLEEKYKKLNRQTYLIPNGANVSHIASLKKKRLHKQFTITCLSSFEKYRGMHLLVDAFKIFKKQYPGKSRLVLIGGGPDFEWTKERAENDPDITFTGYKPYDEAISICKGSDILVMPALDVQASRTISSAKTFAYIACEVPIVVTDTGDHAYFVEKTKTGIIVKATPESLCFGIEKLFTNKVLGRELRANSKKNKHLIDFRALKKVLHDEIFGV